MNLGVVATRLVFASLPVAVLVWPSVQPRQPLRALTVPSPALPEGCGLVPHDVRAQYPGNPWSGTDPKIVATVHQAIEATRVRPLPDVLPRATQGDAPSNQKKWTD